MTQPIHARLPDCWHILRDGSGADCYTWAQLRQMTLTGHLLPVDLLRHEASEEWQPASQLAGLFDEPSPFLLAEKPASHPLNQPEPVTPGRLPPTRTAQKARGWRQKLLSLISVLLIGTGLQGPWYTDQPLPNPQLEAPTPTVITGLATRAGITVAGLGLLSIGCAVWPGPLPAMLGLAASFALLLLMVNCLAFGPPGWGLVISLAGACLWLGARIRHVLPHLP